jgi:3-hydroxybutyryl-CoA dehydrogenase
MSNFALENIKTIGVIGAGQMGLGIAEVCANAGYWVTLSDLTLERAQAAKDGLARRLAQRVSRGKLSAEARDTLLTAIVPADLEGQAGADLVIEAASENVGLKLELFERLERIARPGVVLASNTSSISLTRIAAATKRPELVAGMHFMNPVPVMDLCELVCGLQTVPETMDLVEALARRLGKTTVRSLDRPGFIVNRVLIPFLNEACFALEEGVASAEDIDTAVRLGLNHPMGPLTLADLIGLDTVLAIAEVLYRDFADSKYRPAPLLKNLVTAGWLGKKTRRGFYSYDAEGNRGAPTVPSRGEPARARSGEVA